MRGTAIVVLGFTLISAACQQREPQAATAQRLTDTAAATPGAAAAGTTEPKNAALAADREEAGGQVLASDRANRVAVADARPTFEEVTIPEGTPLTLVLDTPVASDRSRPEEPVHAHLARAVRVNGRTALPAGSAVSGNVTDVERSGKVKGRAHLALRFHEVSPQGEAERYRMQTSSVSRTARATKRKDAVKIGGGALGGAVVGGLIGGKKGAAIGTAVGGGAGSAVVMSTRGEEVRLGKGATVTVRLAEPLTIRIPRG